MRRRDFIVGIGAAAAWPMVARAQSERVHRIAWLNGTDPADADAQADLAAFKDNLRALGWKIGDTLFIEERWADGNLDRAENYAKELVGAYPDVIVTAGIAQTTSALKATKTIPIIFARVSDPLRVGIVANLARPGGNVTGFTNFEVAIGSKWLQILKEMVPGVARVVVMGNPQLSAFDDYFRVIEAAAAPLSITPVSRPVHDMDQVAAALSSTVDASRSALVVLPDGFMNGHQAALLGLAAKYRLPAIYPFRTFAVDGGLVAYAVDTREQFRQAAAYADRILKGAKPGDLPVQFPTKYELVINLRAANAIGLSISPSLLARADEVIE